MRWTWSVIAAMSTGIAISQIQSVNYYLAIGGGCIKPTVISQVVTTVVVLAGTFIGTAFLGFNVFSVALFLGICIFLRNSLYLAHAYSKQFSYNFSKYQWSVYIKPAIVTLICVAGGYVLKAIYPPDKLFILLLYITITMVLFAILNWFFVLPNEIKNILPTNRITKLLKLK